MRRTRNASVKTIHDPAFGHRFAAVGGPSYISISGTSSPQSDWPRSRSSLLSGGKKLRLWEPGIHTWIAQRAKP